MLQGGYDTAKCILTFFFFFPLMVLAGRRVAAGVARPLGHGFRSCQWCSWWSPAYYSQLALVVKNPPANAGDVRDAGSIPGWERSPGVGNGNPLQVFLLGESHGQRNLVGYGPQGRKELDTRLKRLSTLSLAVPFLSVIVIEVCTFFLFYGEVTHVG